MSDDESDMPHNRFKVKTSVSVRDRIIFDVESTETLIYMVKCAKTVLNVNYNYSTFCKMIRELVNVMEEEDLAPSLLCGMDELDKNDERTRSELVNKYIDQLLRFMAMKVLLSGGGIMDKSMIKKCPTEDKMGNKLFQLNPSLPIRESWKALMILPRTYADVCKAFGCDPMDYDNDAEDGFQGELSKDPWALECYKWTAKTYTHLYINRPPKMFWPEPKDPEEDVSLLNSFMSNVKTTLQRLTTGPNKEGIQNSVIMT
jgi:hypothetical protein